MTLERLVREVSRRLADPAARGRTIGLTAEELGEHPWRVLDALEAVEMIEGGSADERLRPAKPDRRWSPAR